MRQAPSPEALADMEALVRDHGMSRELIASLLISKKDARAHLGFFKRMMFVTNGGVMTIGLMLAGFGGRRLMGGFSIIGAVCFIIGVLLFLKFMAVFAGMAHRRSPKSMI